MNRVFYRPLSPGVSELWARCSNCHWSGSMMQMMYWHHDAMQLDLWTCRPCYHDSNVAIGLRKQGWTAWDR